MGQYKLCQEIIAKSNAHNWEDAKKEWDLDRVYESDEPLTCLCGHYPIINICVLYNVYNHHYIEVGNECVKKFFKIRLSDAIIKSIKKVKSDIRKSINIETIDYLHAKKCINDYDYNFYKNIKSRRNLSDKQWKYKEDLNRRFLRFTNYELNISKLINGEVENAKP